jgi:hypothetical protein
MANPLRSLAPKIVALAIVTVLPGAILAIPALLSRNMSSGIWVFTSVTKVGLMAALIGALPIIVVLHFMHANRLVHYAVGGVVLGLILSAVLLGPGMLSSGSLAGWPSYAAQIFIVVILAAISAVAYWFIARPDRMAEGSSH